MHRSKTKADLHNQSGAVLLVALVMLILITIVGIAAARTQVMEVRMAGNLRNRSIAMQSAEAGLRNGEAGILQDIYTGFSSNTAGQYFFDPAGTAAPVYLTVNWSDSTQVLSFNGPAQSSSSAFAPPVFIVEQLPAVAVAGESISSAQYGAGIPPSAVYRITSYAQGGDATSSVRLQSTFH